MAEIKIEKKTTPVWPWILLAVIVIGLLIYFLSRNSDADPLANVGDTTEYVNDTSSVAANQGEGDASSQYIDFINRNQSMDINHEYTQGALLRLADAIRAKANQVGYTVERDLDKVRKAADDITQDPQATTHANKISNSAVLMADVMNNIQQSKFPNLNNEAQEVKNAANSIKPGTLTLEQKDAVKSFFDRSAQLLQRMNN